MAAIHIPPEVVEAFRKGSGINVFAGDVAAGITAALEAWAKSGMARKGSASEDYTDPRWLACSESTPLPFEFRVIIIRTEDTP